MDVALVDTIEVPRLRGLFGQPLARVTLRGTHYFVRNQVAEWWPGLDVEVAELGKGAAVRLLVEAGQLAKGSTVVALGEPSPNWLFGSMFVAPAPNHLFHLCSGDRLGGGGGGRGRRPLLCAGRHAHGAVLSARRHSGYGGGGGGWRWATTVDHCSPLRLTAA